MIPNETTIDGEKMWRLDRGTEQEVYIDANNSIRYMLNRCPRCGDKQVISHSKRTTMCKDCGDRLLRYNLLTSRLRNNKISDNELDALEELITDYLDKEAYGFNVPNNVLTIHQTVQRVSAYRERVALANKEMLDAKHPFVVRQCVSCSTGQAKVRKGLGCTPRCDACQQRYDELDRMCKSYDEPLDSVRGLIGAFELQKRRGFRVPDKKINKLRERYGIEYEEM